MGTAECFPAVHLSCYDPSVMSLRPILLSTVMLSTFCEVGLAQVTIEGRVALPKAKSAPVMTKRYEIVTKGGVLATNPPLAIVYLEGASAPGGRQQTAQVTQKEMNFVPTLLAIATGTKVEFPNEDGTYHNIFSYSPAKRFDLGRYRPDERPIPSVVFDQPGLVTLRCDIHEHMRGLILVLDTPYFTTTEADGRFRLTGCPAGKYIVKAWIDSRTTYSKPIEIKADAAALHVDFP